MPEPFERIIRPATEEEKARHAKIREQIKEEFPPKEPEPAKPAADVALSFPILVHF